MLRARGAKNEERPKGHRAPKNRRAASRRHACSRNVLSFRVPSIPSTNALSLEAGAPPTRQNRQLFLPERTFALASERTCRGGRAATQLGLSSARSAAVAVHAPAI